MQSITDWDARYRQQAGWTRSIRSYLFKKHHIESGVNILDVGCGTGVISQELAVSGYPRVIGVDIDFSAIHYSNQQQPSAKNAVGDAYHLPFRKDFFDLVICHFLLLWLKTPVSALVEMKRVLKPGGQLFLLAEPDHAARVDYPVEFESLGIQQTKSLANQGANIRAGRQTGDWLSEAGFQVGETGIMGGQWSVSDAEMDLEWKVIDFDLKENEAGSLQKLRQQDLEDRRAGRRVMFVPIFFAQGIKED